MYLEHLYIHKRMLLKGYKVHIYMPIITYNKIIIRISTYMPLPVHKNAIVGDVIGKPFC